MLVSWHWCVWMYVYVCVCACVCVCVCVCVFGDLRGLVGWLGGWVERVACIPEFPSVWPPYRLGALETLMLGSDPHLPLTPRTLGSHRHDDNKHVSRHTPEQSAIRFTVHEIWWCFYWSKDLSLIIYRLLPGRLWCQRAPSTLRRIKRGRGKEIGVRGGGWVGV